MEEQRNYIPTIIYSGIDGNELLEIYSNVNKNKNISRGLKTSIKQIGRPSKITEEAVKRAYRLWNQKKKTQKEIAENWNVSERTVRRKFAKYTK